MQVCPFSTEIFNVTIERPARVDIFKLSRKQMGAKYLMQTVATENVEVFYVL